MEDRLIKEELAVNLRKSLYLVEDETPNATVWQIADAMAVRILREFKVERLDSSFGQLGGKDASR